MSAASSGTSLSRTVSPLSGSSASSNSTSNASLRIDDTIQALASVHFSSENSSGAATSFSAQPFIPTRESSSSEALGIEAPLHEWNFPSGHLPIGVRIDATYDFGYWNLGSSLNQNRIETLPDLTLTDREKEMVDAIKSMMDCSKAHKDVLALQKCSPAFLAYLEQTLPKNMEIVRQFPAEEGVMSQSVILYDSTKFTPMKELSARKLEIFSQRPDQLAMSVVLKPKDASLSPYVVLNAHLPSRDGDKSLRHEFIEYLNNVIYAPDIVRDIASSALEVWTIRPGETVVTATERAKNTHRDEAVEQAVGFPKQWRDYLWKLGLFLHEGKYSAKVIVLGDMDLSAQEVDQVYPQEVIGLITPYYTHVGPALSQQKGAFSRASDTIVVSKKTVSADNIGWKRMFPRGTDIARKMQQALRLL